MYYDILFLLIFVFIRYVIFLFYFFLSICIRYVILFLLTFACNEIIYIKTLKPSAHGTIAFIRTLKDPKRGLRLLKKTKDIHTNPQHLTISEKRCGHSPTKAPGLRSQIAAGHQLP